MQDEFRSKLRNESWKGPSSATPLWRVLPWAEGSFSVSNISRMQNEIQRCWTSFLKRINMWSRHYTPSYIYLQSESESCWVMSDSLRPHGLYSPWNSPAQNTRLGSISLLQGIFPTQGSNPGLLHCRQILYQLSHQGNLLYISKRHEKMLPQKSVHKCSQ